MDDVTPIEVPIAIRNKVDLEYEGTDTMMGVVVDLNGDGVADYVIRSAASLCGNGGCSYSLFDGATGNELGQVFGNPLYFRAEKAGGYPIIVTLSHLSAESSAHTTYRFSGSAYVTASSRVVRGTSLDSLESVLRRIPLWPGLRPDAGRSSARPPPSPR